ncbi:MAG: hypothetical protein IKN52_02685 [Victivallales bacterium]|nr:hypothetical protein [Victivallales bacterium]
MEERENETKNWLDAVIGFHTAEDGAAKRPPNELSTRISPPADSRRYDFPR